MSAAGREKDAKVLALGESGRVMGPKVGRIVSGGDGAPLRVDYPGNRLGPLPARVAGALSEEALARAARDRDDALLLFEDGDSSLPIVVALLRSATPLVDAALAAALPSAPRIARADGRRVEIDGKEEVVLRCGRASLTLRADGTVLLRGVNIVTQAARVQKIRGGKVQIN